MVSKTKAPSFMDDKSNELLCSFCKKPETDHYKRGVDGKIIRTGPYKNNYIKLRCSEQMEQLLASYYYSDVLRRGPKRPDTSILNSLYSKNEIGEGIIPSVLIVSEFNNFLSHFKAFIKHVVFDNKDSNMRFKFLDIVDLRTLKFEEKGSKNFSQFNDDQILVFDLGKEAHTWVTDVPYMKELMLYRERIFLPIWFISQQKPITNRNIDDPDITKKIHSLKSVTLGGSSKSVIVSDAWVEESIQGAESDSVAASLRVKPANETPRQQSTRLSKLASAMMAAGKKK